MQDDSNNPPENQGQDGQEQRPALRQGAGANRQGQGGGQGVRRGGGQQQAPRPVYVKPTATRARPRRRHILLWFSLIWMVLGPTAVAGWYLYTVADRQYASTVGFAVRKEEINSPVELLGGITQLSGSASSDTDILYEFIQSQELVAKVDAALDLRTMYSKPDYDPVFAVNPDSSIEVLVDYWNRVVKIFYDSRTQLIELRVTAFDPDDAQAVGQEIFDQSSRMINELSAIAREDATRYAREELDRAVERLKQARQAVTLFRTTNQLVDPNADLQGQMGVLNSLQQQQAEALIELDLLRDNTREGDPRIVQAQRRIEVIADRIEQERNKLGIGGDDGPARQSFATLVGEYERLVVDREFAEQAYTAALSAFDAALSEAQRQSRYLAAYIKPTKADQARYPQRMLLTGLVALFSFLAWAIVLLVYYSVRDRR
ncbi:MAG: capsule biosynthesis protein [Sulfitobacter sp.]|uniref:capsule biosynthesis protein n=1 Tax=Sulfitobacter sp. TaxID=1903071 RepID=UPI0040595D3A